MKKVIWGVLTTAKIGRERVLPGMLKSGLLEIRAIGFARRGPRARRRRRPRHSPGLRLVRSAARRSRDRGDLQSAAQSPARAAHAAGRGRGQARAVRKADRADGGGGDAAARGGGQGADRRSVHGALPSAVAAGPRAGAGGPHRHVARGADVLRLQQSRSRQRPQQGRHRRRRPLRHRLLRDRGRALLPRRGADARHRARRPRPDVSHRSPDQRADGFRRRPAPRFHRVHADRPAPAPPALRQQGPDRAPHPGQRAAGRGDAHLASTIARRWKAPASSPRRCRRATSTSCRARRSRARCAAKSRCPTASRTRSPTCAPSTRCSDPRGAAAGKTSPAIDRTPSAAASRPGRITGDRSFAKRSAQGIR